jgi:hypothetical protein
MKEIGLILAFLTMAARSFGQHGANKVYAPGDFYCQATDFTIIDTLGLWTYRLDSPYVTRFQDSVKPVGYISFWRIKPIPNTPKFYDQARWPAIDIGASALIVDPMAPRLLTIAGLL